MRSIAFAAALLALSAPAFAQENAGQLLADTAAHSIPLKSLDTSWRRVVVSGVTLPGGGMDLSQLAMLGKGGGGDAMGAMLGMSMFGAMLGGGGSPMAGATPPAVLYTRGQTLPFGSETFLVAYRFKRPEVNLAQLIAESEANGGKEPDFAKLAAAGKMTADSSLSLVLVNVRSLGAIADIRPFNLERELTETNASQALMEKLAAEKKAEESAAPTTVPDPPRPKPAAKPPVRKR